MNTRFLTISTLLATTLSLASCGEVESLGEGQLALRWQVSPMGCSDAGLESVEVRVTGPQARVERFACDRGEADFDNLPPGLYQVELFGFDPDGEATFAAEPENVTVDADQTETMGTLRLLARPASVHVGWVFSNGRVCGANDVDGVVVAVFDDFDYEVAHERFSCDDGSGLVRDLRAGAYLVEASGYDGDEITWRGTIPVKVDRGDDVSVEIELSRIDD